MSLNYLLEHDDTTVSKQEAIKELHRHNACIDDFLFEMGDHEDYNALEVLYWLGY